MRCGLPMYAEISTHALREEGDCWLPRFVWVTGYFYPRPPRGGRLLSRAQLARQIAISTHALREEGDAPPAICTPSWAYFYPRPP